MPGQDLLVVGSQNVCLCQVMRTSRRVLETSDVVRDGKEYQSLPRSSWSKATLEAEPAAWEERLPCTDSDRKDKEDAGGGKDNER